MKLMLVAASVLLSALLMTQPTFAHEECGSEHGGHKHDGPGHHEFHHPAFDPLFFQAVIIDGKGPKEGPCSEIKLDKDQRAAIKDAFFKFKEANIDLEANVEKADLAREKVQFDEKATFEAADAASKAKLDAVSKLMAAHDSFHNELEFKILKPAQRGPARMCEMMHGHHHHGPHHDGGPQKGKEKAPKEKDKKDLDHK